MIIELITPLLLATAPIHIELPEIRYDHTTQQSIQLAEYKNQTSFTYGTQTGGQGPNPIAPRDQDTD
jgi:hypothetical protein